MTSCKHCCIHINSIVQVNSSCSVVIVKQEGMVHQLQINLSYCIRLTSVVDVLLLIQFHMLHCLQFFVYDGNFVAL